MSQFEKIAQFFQSGNYELAKQLCLSVGISEAKARLYERFYKAGNWIGKMDNWQLLEFDSLLPCMKCFRYAEQAKEYDFHLPLVDVKCPVFRFVMLLIVEDSEAKPPKELAYISIDGDRPSCSRFVAFDKADTITEAGPNQLPLFQLQ